MFRTILVTEVENPLTGENKEIYGRYDAVKLEKDGFKIVRTFKRKYTMTDAQFAKYAQKKEEI